MHCSDQTQLAQRWIPLTVWCVFGLLLLGKLGLAAHAGQYGFTLALPATVLLAVSAISLWPEFIRAKAWGTGALVRWGSAGVLVAFFWQRRKAVATSTRQRPYRSALAPTACRPSDRR